MHPIRPAVPTDAPALVQMVRALQAERRVQSPTELTDRQIRYALFAHEPSLCAVVADTGVTLAGMALYARTFSVFRAGPALHVDVVYVKPEYRRRGLAREMLADIAARGHAAGIEAVTWLSARAGRSESELIDALGVRPYDNLRFVRAAVVSFAREREPAPPA